MITKEKLKDYANKLMFDMEDNEYETLLKEFDVIEEQMKFVANIEGVSNTTPMTFPFDMDYVVLRDDSISENIDYKEALKNSKNVSDREIKVPKVVE